MSRSSSWQAVFYILLAVFVATAALNMLHVHAGFLTNHAADLVVPAWLYVAARGLDSPRRRRTLVQRTIGRTPEIAGASLFVASTLTEVSQRFWPGGFFPGRFDPLDLIAYGCGLTACYAAEKIWPVGPVQREVVPAP